MKFIDFVQWLFVIITSSVLILVIGAGLFGVCYDIYQTTQIDNKALEICKANGYHELTDIITYYFIFNSRAEAFECDYTNIFICKDVVISEDKWGRESYDYVCKLKSEWRTDRLNELLKEQSK